VVIRANKLLSGNGLLNLWFAMSSVVWPIELVVGDQIIKFYYFFTFITILFWASSQSGLNKRTIKIFIFCISTGVISIAISLLSGLCQNQYDKSIQALPVLAFLFAIGYEIGVKSSALDWMRLRKFSLWILLIIVVEMLVEFFFPDHFSAQASYRGQFKYSSFLVNQAILPTLLFLLFYS